MKKMLEAMIEKNRTLTGAGRVATYIPELSKADGGALGVHIYTIEGEEYYAGECSTRFTMQSISKIVILLCAIEDNGMEKILSRVGIEPTAASFNSIVDLETNDSNKPLNPMINSGAIVTTSLVQGEAGDQRFKRLFELAWKLTGNPELGVNENVYRSEKSTGHRNRALAYFLKSTGIIKEDVEEVLDVYFRMCSLEVTCRDIARIAAVLAGGGTAPWSGERIVHKDTARIVNAVMATCGMYDASGEFAVNVGIPGKSGVSGGILASVPGRMGIGVVGPALDEKGNSIGGLGVLSDLSRELGLSLF